MRAAFLKGPRQIEIREVPDPEPGPGELILKVEVATTDGTDLKAYLQGGHPYIPPGSPFGHEYTGVVVKTGPGALYPPGTPVMGVNSAPCRRCFYCRKWLYNLCENLRENLVVGAYAQYLRIPYQVSWLNVRRRPFSIPPEIAPLMEPLACVFHGIQRADIQWGEQVLVVGTGSIGLMFTHVLAHRRGARVLVAGRRPERLRLAQELGATETLLMDETFEERLRDLTEGRGADVVIEATGAKEIWEKCPAWARKGGRMLLFGGLPQGTQASFDAALLHYSELTLIGAFHHTPDTAWDAYNHLFLYGKDLQRLISGKLPLSRIEEAFEKMAKGEGIKYAILPWEES